MNEEQPPITPEPLPPGEPTPLGEPTPPGESTPPRPAPESYPFWTYGDLVLFFGLAIPCLLLGWAVVKAGVALFQIHVTARAAEPLAEQFIGYLFLFGALALIFRIQYDQPFWRSLAWKDFKTPILTVVILGLATAFGVAILGTLIHTPTTKNTMTELMQGRTSLILMMIFGITLGPVCEELAFRGLVQPLVVRSLGAAPGIILAAIPFGLLHYREYGNSWRHAVIVAAAGAAFGWVRHTTGSTKASTIMHSSYNALFFVALIAGRNAS